MSYIHNALKKAQKEKDSRYSLYSRVILEPPQPIKVKKRILAGISFIGVVLLASTAFSVIRYYSAENLKDQTVETSYAAVCQKKVNRTASDLRQDSVVSDPSQIARACYQAAVRRQRMNHPGEAEKLYRRVLEIEPDHAGAMNNLGVICLADKRYAEAIHIFRTVIERKENVSDPYYNLACLYARQNNKAGSIRYLKAAIAVNREVIDWAKNDMDLKSVSASEEFRRLMENKGE
jgi:Tfp pilus assembly protein PilF